MKKRLHLIEFSSNIFKEIDLKDTAVIACQHILGTNLTMFEYLFEKGLKPESTFLLGKCYSTNIETLKKFKRLGVNVSPKSISFKSHEPFDNQFDEIVVEFIKETQKKVKLSNFKKVILIDDGGYLVYWANSLLSGLKNITAIEQTSSGYVKLKDIKLNFPVINVARAESKLILESQFISELILEKVKKHINKKSKVLIVGSGAIGNNLFKLMNPKFNVSRFDLNSGLSDITQEKFRSELKNFDVIIGCTGSTVIHQEDFGLLKRRVMLISASSSDREFSAVKLRDLVPEYSDCHKDVRVNELTLVNSGFPVNFDGKEHSAEPEKIQLTRALMFSAICLAKNKSYPSKLVDLDPEIQRKIIRQWNKINK